MIKSNRQIQIKYFGDPKKEKLYLHLGGWGGRNQQGLQDTDDLGMSCTELNRLWDRGGSQESLRRV